MDTHIVARAFSGAAGKRYQSGDSVDASEWPLRPQLESQGYLKRIAPAEVAETVSETTSPASTEGSQQQSTEPSSQESQPARASSHARKARRARQ